MEILTEYQQAIRELSEKIVNAQKPIRILNALKWDREIQEYFFKHKFKKLPPVNREYYLEKVPLDFDARNGKNFMKLNAAYDAN